MGLKFSGIGFGKVDFKLSVAKLFPPIWSPLSTGPIPLGSKPLTSLVDAKILSDIFTSLLSNAVTFENLALADPIYLSLKISLYRVAPTPVWIVGISLNKVAIFWSK